MRRRSAERRAAPGDRPPAAAVLHQPESSAAPSISSPWCWRLAWLAYEFALNAKANLGARNIASGLRLPAEYRRLRHQSVADPVSRRPTPTAASSWSAFSTRCWSPALGIVLATMLGFIVGIARLSPNWLLARLAGGYVEIDPQPAAPVPDPVLVSGRARHAAGTAAEPLASSARSSSTTAASSCRRPVGGEGVGYRLGGPGARRAGGHRARHVGETAARADRAHVPGAVDGAGADRRPAADRVPRVRLADRFRHAAAAGLQFRRRHAAHPGIRGAADRAHDLYGRLHRRGRARRHPGGPARADRGRRWRSGCGAASCCGWSSSRRLCA